MIAIGNPRGLDCSVYSVTNFVSSKTFLLKNILLLT